MNDTRRWIRTIVRVPRPMIVRASPCGCPSHDWRLKLTGVVWWCGIEFASLFGSGCPVARRSENDKHHEE
jgi:hypothetical protein